MDFFSFPIAEKLVQAQKNNCLAHVYLLYGDDNGLLEEFSTQWVSYILKIQSNEQYSIKEARNIYNKHLSNSLFFVYPDNKKNEISVQQIRDLRKKLSYKSNKEKKIIVIYKADRLNTQAQNALLKTLEEPIGDSVFILITEYKGKLLETIISRCQNIPLFNYKGQEIDESWHKSFQLFSGVENGMKVSYKMIKKFDTFQKKSIDDCRDYEQELEQFKLKKKEKESKLNLKKEIILKQYYQKYLMSIESFIMQNMAKYSQKEVNYIHQVWQEFSEIFFLDFVDKRLLIKNFFLRLSVRN